MPLTFAHPAVAMPLQKLLGRVGFLPALAIGSMAPDVPYFVPLDIDRHFGHSIPALFWFCIPMGWGIYWLFEYFLKQPFISLCPIALQSRLVALPATRVSMTALVVSLLIGVTTHLLWDSFTHANSPWLGYLPFLETYLFSLGNYKVYVFKVFQHGGTFVGLGLIAFWSIRWYKNAPHQLVSSILPLRKRIRIWGSILISGILLGTFFGIGSIGERVSINAIQQFLGKAITTGVATSIGMFLLYSSWWHYSRQKDQLI
jgi:membrane-bound metal-dependent hydrolase YbcI (DUF457 family)